MPISSLIVFSALLVGVAGCNERLPSEGQYDLVRVKLSEDKAFRDELRNRCVKDFSSFGPSATRVFAVLLNANDAAAMRLTCDRLIQGIVDKRLTYNDIGNLIRLAR